MAAVFGIMCAIAFIWSGVRYQIVYSSVIDSFPPQFRDPEASRYAFPVLVLSPPIPLSLQADYLKSLSGGCVAFLCLSLCFFSLNQPIVGCVVFAVFLASIFYAVKSWRIYQQNRDRPTENDSVEKP